MGGSRHIESLKMIRLRNGFSVKVDAIVGVVALKVDSLLFEVGDKNMRGKDVIESLKRKFKVKTDNDLGRKLGITVQAIQNWKNRSSITSRQIAGLVSSARVSGGQFLASDSIRPVVEFFPIEKCESKQGAKYELFSVNDKHPYRKGVRTELIEQRGIYIFFDSRGQAIYAGKARRQNLWKEMTNAFNRDRGKVQKIKRVMHPKRKVGYKTSLEKTRQIIDHFVPLHDLAGYFSAYAVVDSLINKMEAMLVRSFANDLLNIRMEQFLASKKKTKK
jgi:hypothetical protein